MENSYISIVCSFIAIFSFYCLSMYEKHRLHKQNIKLKIRISNLATELGRWEEIIYRVTDDEKTQLKKMLKGGKKIAAISILKQKYGMSLTEAKVYVETL